MKRKDNETFISEIKNIYNDTLDYSLVDYKKSSCKVLLVCKKHGVFHRRPIELLSGFGCQVCCKENKSYHILNNTPKFINKCKKIYGDLYDYSLTKYKGSLEKVDVLCKEHGLFSKVAYLHLRGKGCPKCSLDNKKYPYLLTNVKFIDNSKGIHGDKYDYSKVKYINNSTKVCIICPIHGEFWQTPNKHNQGRGCPSCKESKLEKEIRTVLVENKIYFNYEYRFDWLGFKSIDFYLPDYNIAIECQGEQHYKPIDYFGGISTFEYIRSNDIIKHDLCVKNDIDVIYFTKYNVQKLDIFEDKTFFDRDLLLKYILN